MKHLIRCIRTKVEQTYIEVDVDDNLYDPIKVEPVLFEDYAALGDPKWMKLAAEEAKQNGTWTQIKITDPVVKMPRWSRSRNEDELCICGHRYHRHFDSYENMKPVGCKYCPCRYFLRKPS